jgi:hypothetical protein
MRCSCCTALCHTALYCTDLFLSVLRVQARAEHKELRLLMQQHRTAGRWQSYAAPDGDSHLLSLGDVERSLVDSCLKISTRTFTPFLYLPTSLQFILQHPMEICRATSLMSQWPILPTCKSFLWK